MQFFGRIKLLMVTIHTIKGSRTGDVPSGTKLANICCVLLIHPKIINLKEIKKKQILIIIRIFNQILFL